MSVFTGKLLVSYGFSPNGAVTKKDVEQLNNGNTEIVEGTLYSSQLEIGEDVYNYIEELDIFMCTTLDKYEEYIKVHEVYDKSN
jgi:hypothetical protein